MYAHILGQAEILAFLTELTWKLLVCQVEMSWLSVLTKWAQ